MKQQTLKPFSLIFHFALSILFVQILICLTLIDSLINWKICLATFCSTVLFVEMTFGTKGRVHILAMETICHAPFIWIKTLKVSISCYTVNGNLNIVDYSVD
jgi:hypothetical protein